jgi:hypothetical protein
MIKGKVNMAQWAAAVGRIHSLLQRKTMPEIVNRSAGSICVNAMRYTPIADRAKLRAKYQEVAGVKIRQLKSGPRKGEWKSVVSRQASESSRLLFLAHLRKKGTNPRSLTAARFRAAWRKWAAMRIAAAGYNRLAWFAAAQPFRKWMKRGGIRRPRAIGKPHWKPAGEGVAARPFFLTAKLLDFAVLNHPAIYGVMKSAVQRAVDEEAAALQRQAEQIIARDLRRQT